jgi:hypothetical protein
LAGFDHADSGGAVGGAEGETLDFAFKIGIVFHARDLMPFFPAIINANHAPRFTLKTFFDRSPHYADGDHVAPLAGHDCGRFTATIPRDAADGRGSVSQFHPVRMKIIQPGVAARRLRRVNDSTNPATLKGEWRLHKAQNFLAQSFAAGRPWDGLEQNPSAQTLHFLEPGLEFAPLLNGGSQPFELFFGQGHTHGFPLHLARPLIAGPAGTRSPILNIALADPAGVGQTLAQLIVLSLPLRLGWSCCCFAFHGISLANLSIGR